MATEAKILITADAKGLDVGLRAATSKLAAFGSKASSVFGKFTASLTSFGGLLTGTGILYGIKKTVDGLEELAVASKKTGVAVEDLAKLRYAFAQADVPVESLDKALKFLNQTLGEARAKPGQAREALEKLGVSVNDTALPAMLKIANAIAKVPDAADRAALLTGVFKKSWEDIVPGLQLGASELGKLFDELVKIGGVPTQKAAEAADDFNDSINRLAASIRGPLGIAIAGVLPYITSLSDRFVAVSKSADGFSGTLANLGRRVELGMRINVVVNELTKLKDRLAELRDQEAKGDFSFFGGTAELYSEIAAVTKAIEELEAKRLKLRDEAGDLLDETPTVDVLIQGAPDAAATLTADASAASQAAQAAVPPIVVPIAVGPTGAIGSYADLQAEFARQQGYAAGGLISGPGTGTSDSILLAASNKEFIVNARQTAKFLPLLQAINRNRLPRFASGGQVGQVGQTATYHLNLNGKTLAATAPAGAAADFAAELRREVVRRGRR